MLFEERRTLAATPQAVWDVLWDIERLATCVPGCTDVREITPGEHYTTKFVDSVGPYKISFDADVVVTAVEDLRSVALTATGEDKRLGATMRMDIVVSLASESADEGATDSTGTSIAVTGDMEILGKLASLGKPVVVRKLRAKFADFVENLRAEIEGVPVQVKVPFLRRIGRGALGLFGALIAGFRRLVGPLRTFARRRLDRPDPKGTELDQGVSGTTVVSPTHELLDGVDAVSKALSATGTLPPFRLLQPEDARAAALELRRIGEGAWTYAGGVELVLLIRQGLVQPRYLIDIKRIPGIRDLRWVDGRVAIGAAASHDAIARSDGIRAGFPALQAAASQLGNPRIRTQGTLGGNLCFADPHSDPPTALLLYNASVVIQGPESSREVPFPDFVTSAYETVMARDETLTTIHAQPLPDRWGTSFLRMERFHRPTVNVAVAVSVADGEITDARVAVGCIGPRPERLSELEKSLRGARTAEVESLIAESRDYLYNTLDPVEDLLGTPEYKIHLAQVLLRRAIRQAIESEH